MTHHLRAEHITAELRDCIENCSDCHDVCMGDARPLPRARR